MTKTIFNKGAFKLKGKVINELKGLDGSIFLAITIDHFEGGEKIHEILEITRDCVGHITGLTV